MEDKKIFFAIWYGLFSIHFLNIYPNISGKREIKHNCLTEQIWSIKGEANIFEHQLEDIPLW